jgi:serine/threonine-protein kinase
VGVYRVLDRLGRGGMGEVYRAHDDALGRDVALKILPAEVAGDATRRARFRREARLLASLNHPNIGAIYHVVDEGDILALVLELIGGPTLAERLQRGPLTIAEALGIARQIGEAIDAAHQSGVVHRDLKPANIKLTPDGMVKVLDFGIAKAMEDEPEESGEGPSDPIATAAGVAIGTAAYMSPEQAEGRAVDHRTDVWAFACVLFEMLTGRRAFEGASRAEVLSHVLHRDPDLGDLPAACPAPVRRLLARALRKDPRRRLGYIGDALIEIDDAVTAPAVPVAPDPPGKAPSAAAGWAMAAAGALAGVTLAALFLWPRSPASFAARLALPLPAEHDLVVGQLPALAVSRDGRQVVYRARQDGAIRLFRRSIDGADAAALEGTEDAAGHALSPDGAFVAYVRAGQLYKMPIAGGPAAALGAVGGAAISWGTADTIVMSGGAFNTIRRVSATGGQPEPVTRLDAARGHLSHAWPDLLPDGRTLLFTVNTAEGHHLAVTTLDDGAATLLTPGRQPRYLPSGIVVFARDRELWTARFDPASRRLTGEPEPAQDQVERSALNGFVHFAVADAGVLLYVPYRERVGLRSLQWVDRLGRLQSTEIERRGITRYALSPDETRLALALADADERDVWVVDRQRGGAARLTVDAFTDTQPVWSPDGRHIAYRSDRDGGGVYVRASDGSSEARRLTRTETGFDIPYAFTPDGRSLLFTRFRDYADQDVLQVDVGGGPATPLLAERFAEMRPALSPDGRWLLYQSDESGRLEVYLRPFPDVHSARWPVSTSGGTSPAWRGDGREIFFVSGTALAAVAFTAGGPPRLGPPQALFDIGPSEDRLGAEFEVGADGTRFLVMRDAPGSVERAAVMAVLEWGRGLASRSPLSSQRSEGRR